MAIKRVIHLADVHIPNLQKEDEYEEGLDTIVNKCKELCEGFKPEECRILIAGDLVHQKISICNELLVRVIPFLRRLQEICKVIVIAGNHDILETNSCRVDTLTALFKTMELDNAIFLDGMLHASYTEDCMQDGDVTTPFSGIYEDENIQWALFSIMGEGKYKYESPFDSPRISKKKVNNKLTVGLFHGAVDGCAQYNGFNRECHIKGDLFRKCDVVMAGDIHKRQQIWFGDTYFVYAGSPIQQNMGESVLEHGVSVWDIAEDNSYTQHFEDLSSSFGYYNIVVNDLSDLENDKEVVTNYD